MCLISLVFIFGLSKHLEKENKFSVIITPSAREITP
jgi:hypothetical protein